MAHLVDGRRTFASNAQNLAPPSARAPQRSTVLISYARDDAERVHTLAKRLSDDGINVRLDAWHRDGDYIPEFMRREFETAQRVLIFCSPNYRRRVQENESTLAQRQDCDALLVTRDFFREARGRIRIALLEGAWSESAPDFMRADRIQFTDLSSPEALDRNYQSLRRQLAEGTRESPERTPARPLEGLIPLLLFLGCAMGLAAGGDPRRPWAELGVDAVQALGIMCLLLGSRRTRLPEIRKTHPDTAQRMDEFFTWWIRLWWVWVIMYVSFVWKEPFGGLDDGLPNVLANTLNNLQSGALVLLYLALSSAATPRRRVSPRAIGLAILGIAIVDCPSMLMPAEHAWPVLMSILSGVIATVAFGLFAGRLETRYLNCGWLFLIAMFVYSGVQLLFPVFRAPSPFLKEGVDLISVLLKVYALSMKFALFLVIRRLLVDAEIAFMIKELHTEEWPTEEETPAYRERRKSFLAAFGASPPA